MKNFRVWKKWLCLLLAAMMVLGGCKSDKAQKRESGPAGEATATPTEKPVEVTPTDVPATPTPTEEPATPTPTPSNNYGSIEEEQAAFDKFLDKVFVEFAGTTELVLHFTLEHPEKYGITPDFDLTEEPEDPKDTYETMVAYLPELQTFTYENLTAGQKANYDRLMYEISLSERFQDVKPCMNYLMRENSNSVSNLSTYLTEYMIVEKKDMDNFVSNLKALPAYLDSLGSQMKKLCEEGYGPTQGMFDTTVENIENIGKVDGNVILISFRENAKGIELDEETYNSYVALVEETLKNEVCPAFDKLLTTVKGLSQYISEPQALASREGGKDYYTLLAQSTTGSNWTVDKMYEYLLGKSKQMIKDYTSVYMSDGGVFDRIDEMQYGSRDFKVILDDLKARTTKEFPKIRDTNYTVSALPDELCVDGVLAYFLTPQSDNPDHKVIRVNPKNKDTDIELFSTLAHEGYPGHLYQDEYFRMSDGYHPINSTLNYTGYMEGWATMMGTDAYLWATNGDKSAAFMYDFDYTYSMSIVGCCDIGVNYYNWSKDELRKFVKDNYLSADAADEIYAMVVADPVIYLPYTLCHFQCIDIINELQTSKGMTKMQAYEAFLKVGPCSFDVLRKNLGISPE